jgi:hypothetical protein
VKPASRDAGRGRRALLCAVALAGPLATSGPAHAQTDDVMGFGAAANPPPASEAALLPPPGTFLSDAWSFWPQAWGYVPSLWSSWYVASLPHPAGPAPGEPAAAEANAAAPSPGLQQPALGSATDSLPPPRLVRRRRFNLIITGAGLLLATWATDRLMAQGLDPSPWSWAPLVGPWYLLGKQIDLPSANVQTEVFLIIDGVLQAGGLAMTILGATLTTKRYVVTVKPALDLAPRVNP